jgi:soluble lytic murein transglycosylase-like protein
MPRNRSGWASLAVVAAFGIGAVGDLTYVVVKGDTLTGIARRYGSSEAAIAELNHIPNIDLVRIGQRLRIPGAPAAPVPAPAPAPAAAPATAQHTVVPGQHLTAIATLYGTTVAVLADLNKLANPNRIRLGQVLLVPVPAPPAPVPAPAPIALPSVEELLVRYGREYGVDPNLVKAVAWQESGWKQHVVSPTGAVGVMQVQPETGVFTGQILLASEVNLADVDHNVRAGVRFLAYLLRQTGGNETYAVASYYQGLRSVRQRGLIGGTPRYVANVLALKKRFARAG